VVLSVTKMFINKVVQFLNWEFNPSTNTLIWLGQEPSPNGETYIELEAKQALLLSYLISINGDIASREALQKHIWFDRYVDDKTINATISKLRRALGGDTKSIIKTHPKQGYSFTPSILDTKNEQGVPYHPPSNRFKRTLLAAPLIIFILVLSFAFNFNQHTSLEPKVEHSTAQIQQALKPLTFVTGWSRQPQLSQSALLAYIHQDTELRTRHLIVQENKHNQYKELFKIDNVSAFSWAGNSDTLYFVEESDEECRVIKRSLTATMLDYKDEIIKDCQAGMNLQFISVDSKQEWLYFPDYNRATQVHSLKRYHMQQNITEQLTFPVKTHQMDSYAQINPSNTHIAFIRFFQARHAQLMVYDLKNGSVEKLATLEITHPHRVSWADDHTVVFNKNASTIATIDIQHRKTTEIYKTNKQITMPILYGKTLLVTVGQETNSNTVEINLANTLLLPEYLARSPFTNYAGTTYRRNETLKTAVISLQTGKQEIWLIENGVFTQLTHLKDNKLTYLLFSSNGSKLLFKQDTRLGLIDLTSKAITYLTVPYSEFKPPVFACDSEQTLLLPVRENNQWHLYKYNIYSQQSDKLLSNIRDFHQNCDSGTYYVTQPSKRGIFQLDSNWQITTEHIFFADREFNHFRHWDADGEYIYALEGQNQLLQQHIESKEITRREIQELQTWGINVEYGYLILNKSHSMNTFVGETEISESLL